MAKPTARRYGPDASQFGRPDAVACPIARSCQWSGCRAPQFAGMPVCHYHAIMVYGFMRDLLGEGLVAKSPTPRPDRQAYVYYLLLSPTTVKIGTTPRLNTNQAAPRPSRLRPQPQLALLRRLLRLCLGAATQPTGRQTAPKGECMIILGIILIIIGLILPIPILMTLGIILFVIGLMLWLLGSAGRGVGGRGHWF